ncbi:MAG TPA: hypothetical protein V6D25_09300 [Leptolyngbyaceae cyanobacterium]
MLDTNETNPTVNQAEGDFEGGITGRWKSEDDADGTVFDEENETESTTKT